MTTDPDSRVYQNGIYKYHQLKFGKYKILHYYKCVVRGTILIVIISTTVVRMFYKSPKDQSSSPSKYKVLIEKSNLKFDIVIKLFVQNC